MPTSSTTCLTATRKGHRKLLLIICIVIITTQILYPATSLYAQKADRLFPTDSAAKITINGSRHYQTMDGFGVSEAFGVAGQIQMPSSPSAQKQMLDLLFSTSKGAGFSILRNILPSDQSGHHRAQSPR